MTHIYEHRRGSLKRQFAEESYNYMRGWKTTVQPLRGLSPSEYLEISASAQSNGQNQMLKFIETVRFEGKKPKVVTVPFQDFVAYEQSNDTFLNWFNGYCIDQGIDRKQDIMMVSSCLKDIESAESKIGGHGDKIVSPEEVIDYLRGMFVVLPTRQFKDDTPSIRRLMNLIQAIEQYRLTEAHKNHFCIPHKVTNFRAHKSLWITEAEKGSGYEGFESLQEIKIQHYKQMDVDKMTRPFLNKKRNSMKIQAHYSNMVRDASHIEEESKTFNSHTARVSKKVQLIRDLGGALYGKVYADAGYDRLLGSHIKNPWAKRKFEDILKEFDTDFRKLKTGEQMVIARAIVKAGILPKPLIKKISYLENVATPDF